MSSLTWVAALIALAGCAASPQAPTLAMNHVPRTLRVSGSYQDIRQGGEQYCGGPYMLVYTGLEAKEGLIICERAEN